LGSIIGLILQGALWEKGNLPVTKTFRDCSWGEMADLAVMVHALDSILNLDVA
jgi:hypothetical protein